MSEENSTEAGESSDDMDMAAAMAAAMEGESSGESAEGSEGSEGSEGNEGIVGSPDMDVILDIPVQLAMEVGSTSISIRNLLQLNKGSVIELDRLAGEPLDVLVNGTLIAHGEVVVVNDKFGIRMTDVISPSERIKKLN